MWMIVPALPGCRRYRMLGFMQNEDERVPYLEENLWGYGKRLRFVDDAMQRAFPGAPRSTLAVLDIGCGNGSQLAIPLANAGYQVTALDPHKPSIDRGRAFGSQVRFLHGTVNTLLPHPFDCVILSEVLEHLDTPESLLSMALPYLAKCGVLVVTVPNGYGEFELDRRIYEALQTERLVVWLRSFGQWDNHMQSVASSDCESPHVQRFTLSALRDMFNRHDLQIADARGTSLFSGPMIAHLFARFKMFVRVNAAIADRVPLSLASGWMFVLRRPIENFTREYRDVTQTKVSK